MIIVPSLIALQIMEKHNLIIYMIYDTKKKITEWIKSYPPKQRQSHIEKHYSKIKRNEQHKIRDENST